MSHLDDLNPSQKQAAQKIDGPVLILAGAGTGKTKTITYRIAHLIQSGVDPRNILAVTFTNKAANEMRERVNHLLTGHPSLKRPIEIEGRPFIRTFHSLGVHILKENSEKLGLPKRFTILDRTDSRGIIRDLLKDAGYDPKEHEPAKILSIISKEKGDMKKVEDFFAGFHKNNFFGKVVAEIWKKYDEKLHKDGSLDFDDLLLKTAELLEKDKTVLNYYQNFWKYIHVDEYQDTNEVQYKIAKMLAEGHKNICVVGDADQNIYSWRGATIKNILNFEKDYPGAYEIVLEENYRSTQNILKAANEVISKNEKRKEKISSQKIMPGKKITVYQAIDEYDEANFVVQEASRLIKEGVSSNEIVFLYRANFQSRVLEEVCLKNGLEHQVIGTRFYERKEIKDVLAYIRASINEKDFVNLNRIINYPTRGLGKSTILKIHANEEGDLSEGTLKKLFAFRKILADIRKEIETKKPSEIIHFVIKSSGLEEKFKTEGEEGIERLENVKELASLAKKYDELEQGEAMEKFLEDVSLMSDQDTLDEKGNKIGVKLMTVHAAKGLEFENVFVTGLEAGLFPHERVGEKRDDDEEERRLFYVAITRAKKKLYLSWTSFRTIYGSKQVNMPSEFLEDISADLIEEKNFRSDDEGAGAGNKIEYLIDW